jgi:hypothetical protein
MTRIFRGQMVEDAEYERILAVEAEAEAAEPAAEVPAEEADEAEADSGDTDVAVADEDDFLADLIGDVEPEAEDE